MATTTKALTAATPTTLHPKFWKGSPRWYWLQAARIAWNLGDRDGMRRNLAAAKAAPVVVDLMAARLAWTDAFAARAV